MLINIFEELTWNQFINISEYKNLPLQEQVAYYKQYLQDLDSARQNLINYQNKGRLVPNEGTQQEAPGDPVSCAQGKLDTRDHHPRREPSRSTLDHCALPEWCAGF